MNLSKIPVGNEPTQPTAECPNTKLYRCYDGMATEVEVLEFLWGLVRMLKPKVVVETGTYRGLGSVHIGRALADNNYGLLHTAEPFKEPRMFAEGLLKGEGLLNNWVKVYDKTGADLINSLETIDFAFLDSALTIRVDEAELVLPKLKKDGVILVHDTCSYYVNNHPEGEGPRRAVIEFAKKHDLTLNLFNTPRGIAMMQRKVTQ